MFRVFGHRGAEQPGGRVDIFAAVADVLVGDGAVDDVPFRIRDTELGILADSQGGYKKVSALKAGFGRSDSAQNSLAIGKVAMKIDGEWEAMHIEKYAPFADYRIGELPHPANRPDLKNMAWGDGDVIVAPVGCKHPDLAWEFMRWLQLPSQQEEYAPIMSNLPTILSLQNSPKLTTGTKNLKALGYVLQHIASNAKNAHSIPASAVGALYQNTLRTSVDQALFHEKSPEQALNDVQKIVRTELAKYEH